MTDGAMPRSRRMEISGWGRRPVETCDVYRPENADEIRSLVLHSAHSSLTPRGLGRSYGDASLNAEGAVLSSERLDRMLAFDAGSGILACQSAVSLADIIRVFLPRGFFFPVTPGTKSITIGGAIASDVHGKNHHKSGAMSAWVRRIRLLTAGGAILDCSRDENAEAFWATVGGMGLTGMILEAELQLMPVPSAYMQADFERIRNVDQLLERMDGSDDEYAYAVAWVDTLASRSSLGRSVLMRANHAPLDVLPTRMRGTPFEAAPAREIGVPFDLPDFTLNPLSMRLFNIAFHAIHPTASKVVDCDRFFYPLDSIQNWNRGYGKRGVVQYQCVIPEASARIGTIRLLETLASRGLGSFLTVLKSLGPESGGLLSFPMKGKTLAMDLPFTGASMLDAIRKLDEIVLETGGRVYLAKDSCLSREAFQQMYPRLPEFERVKRELDPEHRFSSSQARRLGIGRNG